MHTSKDLMWRRIWKVLQNSRPMFGCAAGCGASSQRHCHCSNILSRPYVRDRGRLQAARHWPCCTDLGDPFMVCYRAALLPVAQRSHKYCELCSAWLCWHGRILEPAEFRGKSSVPCIALAYMTSWRVSFDWLLSMDAEAVTAPSQNKP